MSNETISANGVHIAGTMQSTNGSIEEMIAIENNGVYEVTLSCTIGDTVEYMYLNRMSLVVMQKHWTVYHVFFLVRVIAG